MKNYITHKPVFLFGIIFSFFGFIPTTFAVQLLAPISDILPANNQDFGTYLTGMFTVLIGVAGILAVLMLVICGIRYMASGLPAAKEGAKKCIMNALVGLFLAMFSVAILNVVNTNLSDSSIESSALPLAPPTTVVPPSSISYIWVNGSTCPLVPGRLQSAVPASACSQPPTTGFICCRYQDGTLPTAPLPQSSIPPIVIPPGGLGGPVDPSIEVPFVIDPLTLGGVEFVVDPNIQVNPVVPLLDITNLLNTTFEPPPCRTSVFVACKNFPSNTSATITRGPVTIRDTTQRCTNGKGGATCTTNETSFSYFDVSDPTIFGLYDDIVVEGSPSEKKSVEGRDLKGYHIQARPLVGTHSVGNRVNLVAKVVAIKRNQTHAWEFTLQDTSGGGTITIDTPPALVPESCLGKGSTCRKIPPRIWIASVSNYPGDMSKSGSCGNGGVLTGEASLTITISPVAAAGACVVEPGKPYYVNIFSSNSISDPFGPDKDFYRLTFEKFVY